MSPKASSPNPCGHAEGHAGIDQDEADNTTDPPLALRSHWISRILVVESCAHIGFGIDKALL